MINHRTDPGCPGCEDMEHWLSAESLQMETQGVVWKVPFQKLVQEVTTVNTHALSSVLELLSGICAITR